jgi:hypothetical protein
MLSYSLIKEFYDDGDDIETVFFHYMVARLGSNPEQDGQWRKQEMAVIEPNTSPLSEAEANILSWGILPAPHIRHREVCVALPARVHNPATGKETDRYFLHYYFAIVQNGIEQTSARYTQHVLTRAGVPAAPRDTTLYPVSVAPGLTDRSKAAYAEQVY